jgi:hypothetical protein
MFAGAVFIPSVETGQRSVMKIALPKAAAWGGAKLTLGAQVRRISCYGFHNKAYAGYRRDRELTLDVRISPTAPVILDKLGVMLWGQRFDADSLPVRLINGVTGYSLVLRIPGKLVVDTDDAKVYACANGAEWISEPFNVDFGVRRTVLT